MSPAQQDWLTSGLTASTAAWQFLGSQVIMARLWLPASVLRKLQAFTAVPPRADLSEVSTAITDYLDAKATARL